MKRSNRAKAERQRERGQAPASRQELLHAVLQGGLMLAVGSCSVLRLFDGLAQAESAQGLAPTETPTTIAQAKNLALLIPVKPRVVKPLSPCPSALVRGPRGIFLPPCGIKLSVPPICPAAPRIHVMPPPALSEPELAAAREAGRRAADKVLGELEIELPKGR